MLLLTVAARVGYLQVIQFEMEQEKELILEGIDVGEDGDVGKESVRDLIRRIYRENDRKSGTSEVHDCPKPVPAHNITSRPM